MAKISGPLLDRIDLHIEVPAVPFQEFASQVEGTDSRTMRTQAAIRCRMVDEATAEKETTMARIKLAPGDADETERLFKLAPHVSGPAAALSWAVYENSLLPVRLRELMRMRIAEINDCHV